MLYTMKWYRATIHLSWYTRHMLVGIYTLPWGTVQLVFHVMRKAAFDTCMGINCCWAVRHCDSLHQAVRSCWVWYRLIGALTNQLLPSYGRQRVGVAASLQTVGAEAGRWTQPLLPPSIAPCACPALPAGSPRSSTMVERIKVTFLAATVVDNLPHEFNMLWMEYSRKVLIIWHGLIPTNHLALIGGS